MSSGLLYRIYRILVELHPSEFRDRFGPEMLWIYDEMAGPSRLTLMLDGLVSLQRQWFLRSGLWKFAVGLAVNAAWVICADVGIRIFGPPPRQTSAIAAPSAPSSAHSSLYTGAVVRR